MTALTADTRNGIDFKVADLSLAATAATAAGAARPTYQPTAWTGGLPCWRTAGGTQWLRCGSLALGPHVAVAVGKWSNGGVVFEHSADVIGDTNGSWCWTTNAGPSAYVKRGGVAAGRDAAVGWASSNVPTVVCMTFDGTNAGTLLYANSLAPIATTASGGSTDVGTASSGARALALSANDGGGRPLNGDWFAFALVDATSRVAAIPAIAARLITYYARRARVTLT